MERELESKRKNANVRFESPRTQNLPTYVVRFLWYGAGPDTGISYERGVRPNNGLKKVPARYVPNNSLEGPKNGKGLSSVFTVPRDEKYLSAIHSTLFVASVKALPPQLIRISSASQRVDVRRNIEADISKEEEMDFILNPSLVCFCFFNANDNFDAVIMIKKKKM